MKIRWLGALHRRLALTPAPQAVRQTLLQEAGAIAAEARDRAPRELERSVEVRDVSHGTRLAYSVGTPDRAGRVFEHGTVKRRDRPWLSRFSARVYHALSGRSEEVMATALESPRGEVYLCFVMGRTLRRRNRPPYAG